MNQPRFSADRPVLPVHRTPVDLRDRTGDGFTAAESSSLDDPAWDAFLESTPQGQFQQSSMWARSKSSEGWEPRRVVVTGREGIVGGFQILHRDSRAGRIGYVSKGPVLAPGGPGLAKLLVDLVVRTAGSCRLRALILQAPDESGLEPTALAAAGFLPNHLHRVIAATAVFDLEGGVAALQARMRRSTLKELRQAETRGVTIREGGLDDAGRFFRLMLATCERQQTAANPPTEEAFRQLWSSFSSRGRIRLTFAELGSETIAGLLCIGFGGRLTLWKKGSSDQYHDRKPNHLLMLDAIRWAVARGYPVVDCVAMDRAIAAKVLQNQELSDDDKHSRYYFLLGFGGRPMLLPESMVHIRNPLARAGYRLAVTTQLGRRWVRRIVSRTTDQ